MAPEVEQQDPGAHRTRPRRHRGDGVSGRGLRRAAARGRRSDGGRPELADLAAEFYADLRLSPFLGRLLTRSAELVGTPAGSISLVDPAVERYRKVAERGTNCRLGQSFPLDEGITGRVVSDRRPVVLSSYAEVAKGHLPPGHSTQRGSVAAVPIWWRGEVIGANVMFAGRQRRFTADEVDGLELLTQLAAAGIVQAAAPELSLGRLIREHRPADRPAEDLRIVVTEVGRPRPVHPSVARIALELVAAAERAATGRDPAARLHVAVVHRPDDLRLLVHDESADPATAWIAAAAGSPGWPDLSNATAAPAVEHIAGWGTVLRTDLPYGLGSPPGATSPVAVPSPVADPSPFTPREREVCELLAQGMTDRAVAARLVISPKTVEKHVGSLLRKTGAHSRTAAVMRAMEHGWIPSGRSIVRPAPGAVGA